VGKAIEIGEAVAHIQEGDTVVVIPNLFCGVCFYCGKGIPEMCENRVTLGISMNGAFAEYTKVPAQAVCKVSSGVRAEQGALIEPLACIVNAMHKLKIMPGEIVLIFGAGSMGLLFLQMADKAGAGKVIVSEVSEYRIKRALENGATRVVDPNKEDLVSAVNEETGVGIDVAIDAVGTRVPDALRLMRKCGRILSFGMVETFSAPIRPFDITHNSLTIIGSYVDRFTFPEAIRLVESGTLDLDKLVTHRFPLRELSKGIDLMRKKKAIKVVVFP